MTRFLGARRRSARASAAMRLGLCIGLGALAWPAAGQTQGVGAPLSELEGAVDLGAFDRFRPAPQAAPQISAARSGPSLQSVRSAPAAAEAEAAPPAALDVPVDLPVLGFATPQGPAGPLAYDETGKWYSQSVETPSGPAVIEGHRRELSAGSPLLRAILENAGARDGAAPATIDAPAITFGGDDYSETPTEATASFEVEGVNYRLTLSCPPEAGSTAACGDDRALSALLGQLVLLAPGRRP